MVCKMPPREIVLANRNAGKIDFEVDYLRVSGRLWSNTSTPNTFEKA